MCTNKYLKKDINYITIVIKPGQGAGSRVSWINLEKLKKN
jgi:hypothetical protein